MSKGGFFMWINCDADSEFDIDIKYYTDSEYFSVSSTFEFSDCKDKPRLDAFFYSDEDFKKFTVGNYNCDNGKYTLQKKYSISYLAQNNVDADKISHFKLYMGDNNITLYPANKKDNSIYGDRAIIRAKELLLDEFIKEKSIDASDYINSLVTSYKMIKLPFMKDYTWYLIDNMNQTFGLSAIEHIMWELKGKTKVWYFGISQNERIFAVAVKSDSDNVNLFPDEDDCTVIYCNNKKSEFYFVIGLLLLDDGQYFCVPE